MCCVCPCHGVDIFFQSNSIHTQVDYSLLNYNNNNGRSRWVKRVAARIRIPGLHTLPLPPWHMAHNSILYTDYISRRRRWFKVAHATELHIMCVCVCIDWVKAWFGVRASCIVSEISHFTCRRDVITKEKWKAKRACRQARKKPLSENLQFNVKILLFFFSLTPFPEFSFVPSFFCARSIFLSVDYPQSHFFFALQLMFLLLLCLCTGN